MLKDCHWFHTVVLMEARKGAGEGSAVFVSLAGCGQPKATIPLDSLAHSPWRDM